MNDSIPRLRIANLPAIVNEPEGGDRWVKSLSQDEAVNKRYPSGFAAHDQTAGYFHRGALYLFGARPGIGKTSLLLALAVRQVKQGKRVYYVNLEMSVEEMWTRLYGLTTPGVDIQAIFDGHYTIAEYATMVGAEPRLEKLSPLWLDSTTDFASFAQVAKNLIPPGSDAIIFVDYLGLFTLRGIAPHENYQLISEVARQLKFLAKGLHIPIIAASQLNREIEKRKRGEQRITMADFRGSGELENHAHAVFGLTRENPECMDVVILKNRNGRLGSYELTFDEPRAAVED
jgi:replicative DNA helicase